VVAHPAEPADKMLWGRKKRAKTDLADAASSKTSAAPLPHPAERTAATAPTSPRQTMPRSPKPKLSAPAWPSITIPSGPLRRGYLRRRRDANRGCGMLGQQISTSYRIIETVDRF
jgi:hypothetical protein